MKESDTNVTFVMKLFPLRPIWVSTSRNNIKTEEKELSDAASILTSYAQKHLVRETKGIKQNSLNILENPVSQEDTIKIQVICSMYYKYFRKINNNFWLRKKNRKINFSID